MIPIHKATEPKFWTELRARGTAYDDAPKDQLRSQLLAEQHELCAYCMRRLHHAYSGAQVEHWLPQSLYPHEAMNYANLLAVCNGMTASLQHCDRAKGNLSLRFNPAHSTHHPLLAIYYSNGMIRSKDPIMDRDLNQVLNLNCTRLVANRRAVAKAVKAFMQGHGKAPELLKAKKAWLPEEGPAQEYAGVALYLLDKKLRRYA